MKKISYITMLVVLMFVGIITVNAETLYGDVNQDGQVNSMDRNILLRYLTDDSTLINEEGKKAADVYKDNKIDDKDALTLRRHLAGWESFATLPISSSTILCQLGDVNQDGTITEADMTLITEYIKDNSALTGDAVLLADVNEDGEVNALDKTALRDLMNENSENNDNGANEENVENANTGDGIMYVGMVGALLAGIMVISYKKSRA